MRSSIPCSEPCLLWQDFQGEVSPVSPTGTNTDRRLYSYASRFNICASMEGHLTDANHNNGVLPNLSFIADNVAEEDAFNSHSRIATAVAGVIRQKKDLKVIGLLGSWGSGKSTVVKFIQDRLRVDQGPERFHCFTYDAWLHQSDPPRRAFLEKLIRFLIAEDLTTDARWEKCIQELNRQIDETETTSTPTLSKVGVIYLISVLLVPIGLIFIGHDWYEATSKENANFVEKNAFWFGWVLIVAPIFAALCIYAYWRPLNGFRIGKLWTGKFWKTHRAPHERDSILSVFTNREVVNQKSRTIRTPDSTTIEFQITFREIMNSVSAEGHRFIFVIDNLDRLPESDAIDLWATIRSFFLGTEHKVSLPTVILPIDEMAVERMYSATHPGDGVARKLATSFMDKTFDLKFHVSRPVISDWHKYLQTQMLALFGTEFKSEWPHQVQVILGRWLRSDGREIDVTPRFINTLLNSIGTLWIQWHRSGISFASMAYYAINRDNIGFDILTEVQKGDFELAESDSNWQLSLAALHYGVEHDTAAQVLLERPLGEAIYNGNDAEFLNYTKVVGFTSVFERILDQAKSGGIAFSATNAIRLYNAADQAGDLGSTEVWRLLRKLYAGRSDIREITPPEVDALETLIVRCPDTEMIQFLETATKRMSAIQDAAFSRADDVTNFVECSRTILKKASQVGLTGLNFTMQGHPKFYLKALALASKDEALMRCLRSNASPEKITEALAVMVVESGTDPAADTCVRLLKCTGFESGWKSVAEAASAKLGASVDNGTAISANCLGYLFKSDAMANIHVRQLVESGNLQNRLHEAFNGNNNSATASIAALLLVSEKPELLTTPDGSTWDSALESRKGLAEQIGRKFSAFGGENDLGTYIDVAKQRSALAPLIRAIASSRFRDGELELPTPADAARNFGNYTSYLTDDLRVQFASKVGASPDFWTELASLDLDGNEPIYSALLDEACTHSVRAATAINEKLKLVAVDQWDAAISSGAEPYGLAIALAKADSTAGLDGNLFNALLRSIPTLCSIGEPAHIERWFELNAALNADLRKILFLGVRDRLTASDTATDLVPLLSAQGNALLREGEFGDRADGAARNIIIPLLSSTGLPFLCDHFEAFIQVLAGCEQGSREAIGTLLRATWEAAETQEAKDRLDLLRRNWRLPEFAAQTNDDPSGG